MNVLSARMMCVVTMRGSALSEESHEPQAENVKRSDSRSQRADEPQAPMAIAGTGPCLPQDLVFAEEAGQSGSAGDSQRRNGHDRKCPGNLLAQAAHVSHVLLPADRVNDRA